MGSIGQARASSKLSLVMTETTSWLVEVVRAISVNSGLLRTLETVPKKVLRALVFIRLSLATQRLMMRWQSLSENEQ